MIQASQYAPLFYNLILILVFIKCISISNKKNNFTKQSNKPEIAKIYLLCIILILFLGMRPVSGYYFGDTSNYASCYNFLLDFGFPPGEKKGEWLWNYIMIFCANLGLSVQIWFTVIEAIYMGLMLWACSRIMKENVYIAMLFCLSTFTFYGGAVNGLRIGIASSILMLAWTYIVVSKEKITKYFTLFLCFCAFNMHHSIILPAVCMVISYYFFYKNIKYTIYIWPLSILLSLVADSTISSVIENIGLFNFDERFSRYISSDDSEIMNQFSRVGFRWDFLLYSAMPILLGWYIVIKKKIYDQQYIVLLNTYILANAFWILVIRASFSNRFASLSWFLYPILLAYPLLKLRIWENQEKKTSFILFGNMFFTYFMWLIGK